MNTSGICISCIICIHVSCEYMYHVNTCFVFVTGVVKVTGTSFYKKQIGCQGTSTTRDNGKCQQGFA